MVRLFLFLLLSASSLGCGIRLFSNPEASIAAHVIHFTRPDCSTFVAQTLREGLTLTEVEVEDYTPRQGDIFEGPSRTGPSVFRLFEGTETRLREGGRNVSMNILAKNLEPAEARRQLDAACS